MGINDPANPTCAGCYWQDGYTHDAQCVNYAGPDADYTGHEICFCYNEDTLTIVDVTDKSNMLEISRTPYNGSQYTHQGWLTENSKYLLLNDELDEVSGTTLTEVAYFDVAPNCDDVLFFGSWSNYPYFGSGNVVVSSIERGLFVLRPHLYLLH